MGDAKDEPGFITTFFVWLILMEALGLALYLLGGAVDCLGCVCSLGRMEFWSDQSCIGQTGLYKKEVVLRIFIYLGIAGTTIGIIAGIVAQIQKNVKMQETMRNLEAELRRKAMAEKNKADQEQQRKNKDEFRSKLSGLLDVCQRNMNASKDWGLNPAYESTVLQKSIWDAVDEASVELQKLDDIVSELKVVESK